MTQITYPHDFPASSQDRVDDEIVRAKKDLEEQKKNLPHSGTDEEIYGLVIACILRIFVFFAKETKALGWGTARARKESLGFLQSLAIIAPSEMGRNKSGEKMEALTYGPFSTIRPRVQKDFDKSPLWGQFEDVLLSPAVARTVADPAPPIKIPVADLGTRSADEEKGRRRRGFSADMERHRAIADIVGQHDPDWEKDLGAWRKEPILRKICIALDQAEIDIPSTWRTGKTRILKSKEVTIDCWCNALELGFKKLVTDQIRYSLKTMKTTPAAPRED